MKTGVLLSNLGTPQAPRFWAVRRYLKQFLSDPYVIDLPRWKWWLILNLIILNIRPFRSAKNYQKIWTEAGSPLLINSQNIQKELQAALPDIPVVLGMRYGNPSLDIALTQLRQQGIERIFVLPLYPQYSHTTTATTFAAVMTHEKDAFTREKYCFIQDYHDEPLYIDALKTAIESFWQAHGKPDKLLMSYHGLPERYVTEGDPYYQQCAETSRLLRVALNVDDQFAPMSFQSRVGFEPWLQPYTLETVKKEAQSGTKTLHVICPGFSCDCLETLEEIALLNKKAFLDAGGHTYRYIPALNASPALIALLKHLLCNGTLKK